MLLASVTNDHYRVRMLIFRNGFDFSKFIKIAKQLPEDASSGACFGLCHFLMKTL